MGRADEVYPARVRLALLISAPEWLRDGSSVCAMMIGIRAANEGLPSRQFVHKVDFIRFFS